MSPDQAYAQLSRALDARPPECNGIDLFTADLITPADVEVLKPICARCDVALLCRQYAKAAEPKAGFWAGHHYTPESPTPRAGRCGAIKQTRPKRDTAATAAAKRIAWCRAHAARLRDGVARGDLEPWYLDAAAHYEAQADERERASKAVTDA